MSLDWLRTAKNSFGCLKMGLRAHDSGILVNINNNIKIDPHLGDVDDSNITSYEITYCSCFC